MTRLSRRTATTTRFSSKGCKKQTAPRCLLVCVCMCRHP